MEYIIIGIIAFITGLSLNLELFKTKKPLKTYDLKKKYKFAKKFDYFVIKEYSNNNFELVYYNRAYNEDFAE